MAARGISEHATAGWVAGGEHQASLMEAAALQLLARMPARISGQVTRPS